MNVPEICFEFHFLQINKNKHTSTSELEGVYESNEEIHFLPVTDYIYSGLRETFKGEQKGQVISFCTRSEKNVQMEEMKNKVWLILGCHANYLITKTRW